jgi:hypothetical protein
LSFGIAGTGIASRIFGAPGITRSARIAAVALLLAFGLAAGLSSQASAATSRPLIKTLTFPPQHIPLGMTSDLAGNIYVTFRVTDGSGARFEKFDAEGNTVDFSHSADYIQDNGIYGKPDAPKSIWFDSNTPSGVAVDQSGGPNNGYIYLMPFESGGAIWAYKPTGEYAGEFNGNGGFGCQSVVNQANGNIFTNVSSPIVNRYAPKPFYEGAIPTAEADAGELACAIAVDGSETLYHIGGNLEFPEGPIMKTPGAFTASPSPRTEIYAGPVNTLSYDWTSGHLFAGNQTQIQELTDSGATVGAPFGGLETSRGLTVTPANRVYAGSGLNSGAGSVSIFGPPAALPVDTTEPATEVLQTTVTLNGKVDPDGSGPVTKCEFQWGQDSRYLGGTVPCSPATPYNALTSVTAELTGLVSKTEYHFRLVTTSANGVQTGKDKTFVTPDSVADVVTGGPDPFDKNSAVLHGSYRGQNLETEYWFEVGTEPGNYTKNYPAVPAKTGLETGPQEVEPIEVTDLMGATEYHYRLAMKNEIGTSYGGNQSFFTPPAITDIETGGVTNVGSESAELEGSFTRDDLDVHYFFEWGPTESYGNITPALPGNEIPGGSGKVDVPPVLLDDLQEGGIYHYRLAATNSAGKTVGADRVFKTAEPPQISNLAAKNVLKTSVDLTAEINPNRGETEWFFEWGQTTDYGNVSPVDPGSIPYGSDPVPVITHLEGLAEGITYHFRLVAKNEFGTRATGDQAFGFYPPGCPNSQVRQETGSAHMPDCRAYELVSPSNAHGTTLFPFNAPTAAYATHPPRIAYAAGYGELPGTGDPIIGVADMYVSSRTASGWTSKYLGKNARETSFMGGMPGGLVMSNTSYGPGNSFGGTVASSNLDRLVIYDLGYPANKKGTQEVIEPPKASPFVYTPEGTLEATWPTNVDQVAGGEGFVGWQDFDAELEHFVFSSNVAFVPGAESFGRTIEVGGTNAAEFKRGRCCPGPIYDNNTRTGEIDLISEREDGSSFWGIPVEVSDDGSHILMGETADSILEVAAPLYMRMEDRTYDIAHGAPVEYMGMDGSGSTVYFTSRQQLTADDHDISKDVFLWEDGDPTHIKRISKGSTGNNGDRDDCELDWVKNCDIQAFDVRQLLKTKNPLQSGQVAANGQATGNLETDNVVSKDSGDTYFVSPEQLDGARGSFGQANIYLYHDGQLRFVASAEPKPCTPEPAELAESPDFQYTAPNCEAGKVQRLQITPDGEYAAFISRSRLTPYNNNGFLEMYVYNRAENRIDCVSCRPDGKPASFDTYGAQNGLNISEDGRTFFSTDEALVPQDTNKANDVYEYVEGKPQLITTGIGEAAPITGFQGYQNAPGLITVSADGTDVYIGTFERLVTQDHNGQELKIYDARETGGFPAEPPKPECEAADECHGAGSSPPASPKDRTGSALEGNPKQKSSKKKSKKAKKKKHRKAKKKKHKRAKKRVGR